MTSTNTFLKECSKEQVKVRFRQILSLAIVTFRELLRDRILWNVVLFAGLLVGLSYLVSQLSFTENARVALSFGLTSISLIAGALSVIMGSSVVAKEVQQKTVYLVLTKSIYRWQYILGKYLGLIALISLNVFLLEAILIGIFIACGGSVSAGIFLGLIFQVLEVAVICSVAIIFSAGSSTSIAVMVSSGIWVIGHAMADLKILSMKIEPIFLRPVLSFVSTLFPDLTRFDLKPHVVNSLPISGMFFASSFFYAIAYSAFALLVAMLVFEKREI